MGMKTRYYNAEHPNKSCVAFWATDELKAALVERAKAEGKSMSELVVEPLEQLIKDRKKGDQTNGTDEN